MPPPQWNLESFGKLFGVWLARDFGCPALSSLFLLRICVLDFRERLMNSTAGDKLSWFVGLVCCSWMILP